jgi:hypothetical protein
LSVYDNVALPLRLAGRPEASLRADVTEILRWVGLEAGSITALATTPPGAWVAATPYAVGALITEGGRLYMATVGGTSAAVTEPTWPTNGTTVVDNTVTWKDQGATPYPLTEGTDYNLHPEGGLLMALSTGGIPSAALLPYTYSCSARTGQTAKAGTDKTTILARIHGPGENKFTGEKGELEIPKISLFPSQTLSFVSKEPMAFTLKGTILLKDGNDYEWKFTTYSYPARPDRF